MADEANEPSALRGDQTKKRQPAGQPCGGLRYKRQCYVKVIGRHAIIAAAVVGIGPSQIKGGAIRDIGSGSICPADTGD